jgi:phosphate/sulfate permease
MDIFLAAVILLMLFAIFDLMVGVSNDAVNFLNSSIGSRVAPRVVIMIIASLGIIAGVMFSSGMMEVARKSIFVPAKFTMPELLTIFLAVMIADVILLDLFNTFGLPTSTTVSIVFELLGGAVVLSLIKVVDAGAGISELAGYINTQKAFIIIMGILLSVGVSFLLCSLAMFFSRLLLTFDYERRIKRYGGLWGGIALALITLFILVKGAKGSSLITKESAEWIQVHWYIVLGVTFIASTVILQILVFLRINILKPIVLIGTFALAMAFAANDLVNFIGVPMAGLHAYLEAGGDVTMGMGGLAKKVPSEAYMLLIAGAVMVATLWISRKSRTVTDTELGLANRDEGEERFGSNAISRTIVRMAIGFFSSIRAIVPAPVRRAVARRIDPSAVALPLDSPGRAPFDYLRAGVNLMVASAVISFATSYKLPLSTTYVTFMVAMGTSFADQAWGRESAVYRITGVLTVIGGWFMTAFLAFTTCGLFVLVIHYSSGWGVPALLGLVAFSVIKTHVTHRKRLDSAERARVFNLKKVKDPAETVAITFEHTGTLIGEIRRSLRKALQALFEYEVGGISAERVKTKRLQQWTNIIIANVFKAMRLLGHEGRHFTGQYAQIARRLQKLADGHRDLAQRAYDHVANHHKQLLPVQIDELRRLWAGIDEFLREAEEVLNRKRTIPLAELQEKYRNLRTLAQEFNAEQVERIDDDTSKTRHSILYYAVLGNGLMLSKQVVRLLGIFDQSLQNGTNEKT